MAKAILVILLVVGVMALAAVTILEESRPRAYMCTTIQVVDASIMERTQDDNGKYWMRVYAGVTYTNWDKMWIEVSREFYDRHQVNQHIGVIIGDYDIYRTGREFYFLGPTMRKYEKNTATVENIYDSFADAREANPTKSYTIPSTIKIKKVTKDGTCFFILDAQGKKVKAAVSKVDYARYNEGQTIDCTFESTGDFVRFQDLVTPTQS
jgi:hypothetical protein